MSLGNILILEDEKNVGSTLVERLVAEGYSVVWARTLSEGLSEVKSKNFDLAILDVGLPDGTGFDLATELRNSARSTAILFLTAFSTPEDKIKGLELGADDYVVKPFHLKELLLRIQNVLKRTKYFSGLGSENDVRIGKAVVRFSRFEIISDGSPQSLTHKELAVLQLLLERRGNVVSRDEILDNVWSKSEYPTARTVDNFIVRLRKLIEFDPESPKIIRSVRGVGYQILEESQ